MTEKELVLAILPVLIAGSKKPLEPTDDAARQCANAAILWAKAIKRLEPEPLYKAFFV